MLYLNQRHRDDVDMYVKKIHKNEGNVREEEWTYEILT